MPKIALVLVTDIRGLELTEHAAAVALLTQKNYHHIILFCIGFLPSTQTSLQIEAQKRGFRLEYRKLFDTTGSLVGYTAHGAQAHVTASARLKMTAISSLSYEFDKALYIDGDILLMQDFDVEKVEFEGATIAAVYDIARCGAIFEYSDFFSRCRRFGRSPHYFNSGLIAVNFANWKAAYQNLYDAALKDHTRSCDYTNDCSCADQCLWNRVFERAWKRLPLTDNLQACAMFSDRWANSVVRHYVGAAKFIPYRPWRNDKLDTALLNGARDFLNLPAVGFPLASVARSLNKFRNTVYNKTVEAAMSRIERMYGEPM